MERSFLDTNVLVYADDADGGHKTSVARRTIDDHVRAGRAVLSTQVLSEFFVIATSKLDVPAEAAQRKVELLARLDVVHIDVPMIVGAIELHRLHGLSLWDALIVGAARVAGCRRLLTEDLQHGRRFGDLLVENPFIDAG